MVSEIPDEPEMLLTFFYSVFAAIGVGLAIAGGKVAGAAARLLTNGGIIWFLCTGAALYAPLYAPYRLTIYAPMIYTAQCVMFLMRADI